MNRPLFPLLALCLLLLGGCGSQPIEPSYYLLRHDEPAATRALSPDPAFALGRITIAPYVAQRGLLLATGDGRIRPARHHLWAEPVEEGVQAFLIAEIARVRGRDLLPSTISRAAADLQVRIDQFHGTADGGALLVAYWWVLRDGEVAGAHRFAERRSLSRDGYAALVDAQRELLATLAGRIAASLDAL